MKQQENKMGNLDMLTECKRRMVGLEEDPLFGHPAMAITKENMDCVDDMAIAARQLIINQIANSIRELRMHNPNKERLRWS